MKGVIANIGEKNVQKVNEQITNANVRLVGEGFEKNSIYPLEMALDMAYEQGLDLVEMSVKDNVSVCKMMNYQKYLYEQKKNKKQTKKSSLKEIKFGCNIADHDLQVAANKALKIMLEGDKVRVGVIFKGRQMVYAMEDGPRVLERFLLCFDDSVVVTKQPKLEGNMFTMYIEIKK